MNSVMQRAFEKVTCLVVLVIFLFGCSPEHPPEVVGIVAEFNAASSGRYSAEISEDYYEIDIHDMQGVVDTVVYKTFLIKLMQTSKQQYLINVFDTSGKLDHVQYAAVGDRDTTYYLIDHYEY